MVSLQQTLYHDTRTLHQRIENNPFMHAIAKNESLDEPYRWLLRKLALFSHSGEKKLLAILNDSYGFEMSQRCRVHLLQDDLMDLGINQHLIDTEYFKDFDTPGKAIGLLYVLEGSRKGGAFLSALLEKKAPHLPMRYLKGYGEKTETQWVKFIDLIEQYNNDPICQDIRTGAIRSFEILEEIFHDTK
ncbi:biliverdin-producing heme oxygenase [Sulfuricurvum sp.]|uniref:biliverdin-producing heme oxygenase n=1 Tax=Sulfuricurvum sp. TaxID=2025608 RepID=UPI002D6021D0|nr:biliverdin-producing heme oxygenase [Sulfuricurvum sp.]HZF70295.1 biliverdin-producing heme oxygenase [Sulfuricurvum sp.]